MNARRLILGMGLLFATTFGAVTMAADKAAPSSNGPWLGVWKLNIDKSNFQTNKPPAGTDRTYAMTAAGPDSFDIHIVSKDPDGKQTMDMSTKGAKFDGKTYKEEGNPFANENIFHLVNERSYSFEEKKDGVHVITISVEISPDGKTRTSKQKSVRDGKEIVNVAVWDRVK